MASNDEDFPVSESANYPLPPEPNRHLPLMLYVGKEVLVAILEDNLAAIRHNAPRYDAQADHPVESRAETDFLIHERESFLGWVRGHPGVNVYLTMFPASEVEVVDAEE